MTGTTWRPDVLADFEHTTLAVPFRGSTIDAVRHKANVPLFVVPPKRAS